MNTRLWPIDPRLRYWHPVASASRVSAKPLAVQCCGVPIVLFAHGRGEVAAMYDRCAHRRMPLSHGVVGPQGIACIYHGCRFAPDGSGYCPSTGSSRCRVPVFETKKMCDVVWVRSADAAPADTGLNPDLADDDHEFMCVVEKQISAPLQLVVDNMTELEHTGKVHRQLAFGVDDLRSVETRCRRDDQTVSIFYRGCQRPLPRYLSLFSGLRRGDFYVQTARVSFTPPCASYRIWWTAGKRGSVRRFGLRFVNYYTESDADHTSLFSFAYWKAEGTLLGALPQLAGPMFRSIVSAELERDKQIIEKVPRDEASLEWFQLNRFDGPLVATRRLMERHYSRPDAVGAVCS